MKTQTKTKYNELFFKNGLFETVFKKDFASYYFELFGELDPAILDAHTNYHFGDRWLSSKVNEQNYKFIIASIINMNYNIWKSQKELLSLKYDITKPVLSEFEKTGTISSERSNTNESLTGGKAFNENEFNDNERDKETGEQSQKEIYNLKNITSGTSNNYDITTSIKKEIEFRRQNFYRNIITDILKQITLKLY